MRTLSRAVLLVAGMHAATLTAPSLAFAQAPQPVPYNQAPTPVPYGQPTPSSTPPPQSGGRSLSGSAPASPGSDVIYLKNGGILRGTIIDAIPNAQARIQLATGEIATVPWSEIARFEHGNATTPPGQPAPARPEPKTPAPAPSGLTSGIRVHIDSPSDVELQYREGVRGSGNKAPWETVCTSPCDRQMSTQGQYRIVGDGARPSREFMLPSAGGTVTLSVSPASTGWFVGGIILMSVGGVTMLVGLFIGLVASLVSTVDSSGTSQDWATGGWTACGIGAAGLILGMFATFGNVHSGVTVGNGESSGEAQGSPWAHVATWRGPSFSQQQRLAPPPVVGVPLYSTSF
jgi:hypothetical protein